MPQDGDLLAYATNLARDFAAEIERVLLTHYPDRDTLDVFRPGATDLEGVVAVNRAVAAEFTALGVEVFVQRADRAAFRRWMDGRDDTPENRRRWIDRTKLLRGADALRLLGLEAAQGISPPNYGSAPGPIANRLVAAYDGEDGSAFDEMVQALLGAGRTDVLDLATRKIGGRDGEDAAEVLHGELLAAAAGGRFGPSGWAELVALPVALPVRDLPDAAAIGDSLLASGVLEDTVEIRFLPGWRSPDALDELSPGAIRRVLLDLVAGVEPRDIPPGDTDDLAKRGFGVMLGVQFDWDIAIWDEIVAEDMAGGSSDDEEDSARRASLFDDWRARMFEAHEGCVPLPLVSPSDVASEIEAFLAEAGEQTQGIDQIREFVAMIRREAGSEEIVCRPEIIGDGLELSFYSESGRFLDSLTLHADQMPARADEMVRLVGSFVRLVKDAP